MPYFCITVDLDRDVNIRIPGKTEAGSLDRGEGTAPRFTSTSLGLEHYLSVLDELCLKATFFAETRTLEHLDENIRSISDQDIGVHGLDHEDFALLDVLSAEERIIRSKEIVRDLTGREPVSFRAPYMSVPDYLPGLLVKNRFTADSSQYCEPPECRPFRMENGLIEIPVCRKTCPDGTNLTSYLWPMHEGKRSPESYLQLAEDFSNDAVLVLSDHSWHIAESRGGGYRSPEGIEVCKDSLRALFEGLMDTGFEPIVLSETVAHAR